MQKHIKTEINNKKINKELVENYQKLNKINKKSFLNKNRMISDEIIRNFSNLKQDEYENLIVPTYTLKKIKMANMGAILIQTGIVSYLKQPILKDKDGKYYNKPIKQLCKGVKGLEIIKADNSAKKLKTYKKIVVCESIIDTLSLIEIKQIDLKQTLLCSTNGQITHSQKELLKWIYEKTNNAEIILGFDNDEKGKEFGKLVEKIIPNASKIEPILKDFNDDLIVGKTLKINLQNINKETIVKTLKEFESKVSYLEKKYDILESNAQENKVKELFAYNLPLIKKIETKIKNVVDFTEVFKKLSNIEKKIERDFSIER